jgi:SAM-dependent methyltransferase
MASSSTDPPLPSQTSGQHQGLPAAEVAAWLDVAADEKAESVTRLAPAGIRSVVDIGSGTGSVLAALDRRGFADEYWACEPSSELAAQTPSISRLAGLEVATFEAAFSGRRFDLAILSHVVEHVRAPAILIAQALDRADHVLVEVPIEATLLTRLRKHGVDRASGHPSGHIHFFNEADARKLIDVSGGTVQGERAYFPLSPYRHVAQRRSQQLMLFVASHLEGVARLHYEHFAMLATARTFSEWTHHYPKP